MIDRFFKVFILCVKCLSILSLIFILFFIYDAAYGPEERLKELDILSYSEIEQGFAEMKRHRIIIAGIARDNLRDLLYVKRHIEQTGILFQDYRVIIFENDSSDGTKLLLKYWSYKNPKVTIISENFGNTKRPSIAFLAEARNRYINYIKDNKLDEEYDMMMVVDMDMSKGWDVRGVADSFSKIQKWDIVCSNGVKENGKMYDMFAFRNEEYPYGPHEILHYWTKVVKLGQKKYEPEQMIPVSSCFGGLAFYKMEAIRNCKYGSVENDCEHVMFHECAGVKNHARIFMNSSQMVRYFSLWDIDYLINRIIQF
jgi:hypothetical protein